MKRHRNDMVDNVHNPERTGMTRAQAEAMAQAMQKMVIEATSHLATRAESAERMAAVEKRIAATERHVTLLVSFSTPAIVTTMIGAVVFG